MGAPNKAVKLFSVKEFSELLHLAKKSAAGFRSIAARVEALEKFRLAILPFAEWIDKPVRECFVSFSEGTYHQAPKRVLSVFRQYSNDFHVVAIDRRGDWITIERTPGERSSTALVKISSEKLAQKIEQERFTILNSTPWPLYTEHLKTIESFGLQSIVEYCAFLKYLNRGVEEIGGILAERERRMQVLRGNLSFLSSFAAGLDPLVYREEKTVETYAAFGEHPGGTSRCSGTYFARGPAQAQVDEWNAKQPPGSETSLYVFVSSIGADGLRQCLNGIYHSVEQATYYRGASSRKPISEEEAAILKRFSDSIGDA
jgi:hypothetical protein